MSVIAKRAGEIMIPIEKYPYIRHSATIREAVVLMEQATLEIAERRSLPRALIVFSDEFELLGVVRRRDILRGLEPRFLRTMPFPHRKTLFDTEIQADPDLVELASGRLSKAFREQAEEPVSGIMQPIIGRVEHDDHLAKVVSTMLTHDLNLLPVLKDHKVVGVVRSVDVFHEVASLLIAGGRK
jgi:CBS-domain-containing membrane protein